MKKIFLIHFTSSEYLKLNQQLSCQFFLTILSSVVLKNMELGVLNKIDRELNNSGNKILIKILMMKIMRETKLGYSIIFL